MKRNIRRGILALLVIVFLISGGMVIRQLLTYKEGEEIYNEAAELAHLPDFSTVGEVPSVGSQSVPAPQTAYVDPYADLLKNMDFSALQEINSDVQGWIVIPGTAISYPLLQGTDNDYYLNHTYKKSVSAVGAIFIDYRCSADLTDFNTIVYGHRMNNGSMFAGLKYYKKQSYYESHPKVYVTTDQGTFTYRIFSAYEGSASGESYQLSFSTAERKQQFLDTVCEASYIETGITPTVNDYILTLSTCTGNGHANRWIVHAMREGPEVEEKPQTPETTDPGTQTPEITESQPEEKDPVEQPSNSQGQDSGSASAPVSDGPESSENASSVPENGGGAGNDSSPASSGSESTGGGENSVPAAAPSQSSGSEASPPSEQATS